MLAAGIIVALCTSSVITWTCNCSWSTSMIYHDAKLGLWSGRNWFLLFALRFHQMRFELLTTFEKSKYFSYYDFVLFTLSFCIFRPLYITDSIVVHNRNHWCLPSVLTVLLILISYDSYRFVHELKFCYIFLDLTSVLNI